MGTAQMVRDQTKTVSWSSIFPPEQVTEQQSALFVKKLLAVAVSSITYLRAIFPEHAFGDRRLEDLNLKILKDDSACPGSCQVIQWLKGSFDALDKKYLRMIIVGIYVDPENPDSIVESYTFKFTYNKDGMSIFRNGNKIASAYTEAETKKATIRLLRTIILLTQTLTSLPDEALMTMKLLYYDEVTPSTYQPPGFKETTMDNFQFHEEPMNIKVGDVSTPFHTVKLRIKTELHQFDFKEDENEDSAVATSGQDAEMLLSDQQLEENDSHYTKKTSKDINDDTSDENQEHPINPLDSTKMNSNASTNFDMECDQVPTESPQIPSIDESATGLKPDEKHVTSTSGENQQEDQNEEDEVLQVDCACSYNEDDGLMIMCGNCNTWQHAVCYGILEEDEAPDLHVCATCSKKRGVSDECTDPSFRELEPASLQAKCLWRRALSACSEMSRILPTGLSRRLGIELSVAHGLINRLTKEGFVRSALKGKRLGKIVNKAKLSSDDIRTYMQNERRDIHKPHNVDDITEKASQINLSGKVRPKRTKDQHKTTVSKGTKERPKSAKKAIATIDGYQEFEISDSQEPAQDDGEIPAKKRKASIANKAIIV
ncbi:HORMA domain-containing protein 1-like [Actinia tenebrosa]|uniref:HORMA domain-containing protein 1-like n=1 Tax=Actinia tenebrosa TaxID=6105 RepID=A0A6P8I0R5_ACTTE|nr:HORMA domain-containing protein 1-like [Actinia tenebrosa]